MRNDLPKKFAYLVGLSLMCATAAQATPAFARQMGMDCMSCHYQNIPKLNSFGREFKMSGFTMTGGQKELTSDTAGGLSLPSTLNMAIVLKARVYVDDKTENTANGTTAKTEIFDESAFILGGKIADNVGTSFEVGPGGVFSGKVIFTTEALGGRVGASYSTTDALGAFAGTETYTTGLYRPVRQFENRKKTNILQNLGIGAGEATVVQAYTNINGLYATVGAYAPTHAGSARTDLDGFKLMARAAYEFSVANTTMMLGGYYIGGDVNKNLYAYSGDALYGIADVDALDRTAYGIDFQLENTVANMPLMVTAAYVLKNDYTSGFKAASAGFNDAHVYVEIPGNTTGTEQDITGFSIDAQLNFTDQYGVKAAFLNHNDNNVDINDYNVYSAGLEYNMRQNVRFVLEYSYTSSDRDDKADGTSYSGGDLLLMAMTSF